jgi:hypothetical protein
VRQASPELQAFVTSALVGVHAEGVAGVLAALASAGCTELETLLLVGDADGLVRAAGGGACA